ncbi:MAG: serine O-acetyltransferase EpsC [Byssovorax sp.]
MITDLVRDAVELTRVSRGKNPSVAATLRTALFFYDPYAILLLTRLREAARRHHVPFVNRALRMAQTAIYGVEIGKEVTLGHGVYFVHSLGTVIGGDAKVGDRVRLMGNNTIGTAKDNGYPIVGDDVWIGCGARILGPVRIGDRAVIGANAVVLHDVPADGVAIGVPAVVKTKDAGVATAQAARMEA